MFFFAYSLFLFFFINCNLLQADTTNANMTVSSAITAACTVTTNNLNFGAYDPTNPNPTDQTTTIIVKCSKGHAYTVKLNQGSTTGATFSQRLMAFGNYTLSYNLFTDNTYTAVWGDGTDSTSVINGTGLGINTGVAHTLYGRIPALQDEAAGTYQDVVQVTIDF